MFDLSFYSPISTFRITDKVVGTMTGYTFDQVTEMTTQLSGALVGLLLRIAVFAKVARFRKLVNYCTTALLIFCTLKMVYEISLKFVHIAYIRTHMWQLRRDRQQIQANIASLQNQVNRYLDK